MKTNKKLLVIPLILLVLTTFGQNDPKSRELTLKFPVTSLLGDFYAESMGFGLGIEKMMKPGLSFSQEITYIFHVNSNFKGVIEEPLDKIHGIKLTTDIRSYLNKQDLPESGWFLSAELDNILTRSVKTFYSGESTIDRYRGIMTLNIGMLVFWDKHKNGRVTLEMLAGGGLGYVVATHSNSNEHSYQSDSYGSVNKFYPAINIGLKIGYLLK